MMGFVRSNAIFPKTCFLKNTMLWGNTPRPQKGKITHPLPYLIFTIIQAHKISILCAIFPIIVHVSDIQKDLKIIKSQGLNFVCSGY